MTVLSVEKMHLQIMLFRVGQDSRNHGKEAGRLRSSQENVDGIQGAFYWSPQKSGLNILDHY